MSQKPNTLLKVVSILFIVLGAFTIITALIGILIGGVAAASGTAEAAVIGAIVIIVVILACVEGILEFAAGILGLQGKLKSAQVLGWIILVLSAIALISSIANGISSASDLISSLCGIVLPILFVIGVRQSDQQ